MRKGARVRKLVLTKRFTEQRYVNVKRLAVEETCTSNMSLAVGIKTYLCPRSKCKHCYQIMFQKRKR